MSKPKTQQSQYLVVAGVLVTAAILTLGILYYLRDSNEESSTETGSQTSNSQAGSSAGMPESSPATQIVNSMYGEPYRQSEDGGAPFKAHPENLHGAENLDWAKGAQKGSMWSASAWGRTPHITSWAECYEGSSGTGERNVRIHIKNLHTYVVDPSGNWKLIDSSDVKEGTYHTENWQGSGSDGDVRKESSGISFTMPKGMAFHPWSAAWPRIPVDKNVMGVLIKADFKMTSNEGLADLSAAKFLCGVGFDIYPGRTATANDLGGIAPGGGHAAFQWVLPNWQTFYFTNMNEAQILKFGHPLSIEP